MNCINFSVGCGHGGGKFAVQCCQRCVELCDNGVVQNHRSRNTKVVISLEVLVAAAVQGTNCKELAIDKGTEMLIWSGQVPMPVTMPTNDTLQGRWYTASGEVVTGPVDSWSTDLDVARKERPAKWISGCRLEQSVAATWCRGKINWVSGLKGNPALRY